MGAVMDLSLKEIFAEIGGQPNSCSLREYCAWARHVQSVPTCRLLVFGVGRDSTAWREVNRGNSTLFLENDEEWIKRVTAEIGSEHIRTMDYGQTFEEWKETDFSEQAVLLPDMADPPFDGSWDCAFVDAPWGPTFGRHQSTHAATCAIKPGGLIALHDCEREREQIVCKILLEGRGYELVEEIERLRIYRAPG